MLDPLAYTKENLEQELNLLEIHLKEAPTSDEVFCKDCCDKHLSTISGYSLEGLSFTDDKNEIKTFSEIAKMAKEMRGRDYQKEGIEMSQKIRALRKQLSTCPTCNINHLSSNNPQPKLLMPVSDIESLAGFRHIAHHGDEEQYYDIYFANDEFYISDEGVIIWRSSDNFPKLARKEWKKLTKENLPKDLNRSLSINQNNTNNSDKNNKRGISMKIKELGIINAGAFLGKGAQILADYIDTKVPTAVEWYQKPSTYINVGGGLALQLLALYGVKNDNVQLLTAVAGANMVTKAVDIGREALAPAPTARLQARAAPLRVTRAPIPAAAHGGLVTVD